MVVGRFRLRILDLLEADPQLVLVVPQATASPFGYWMRPPESFAALWRESLIVATLMAGVPQLAVDEEIVDAHSGGGLALRNAALTGQLRADKVNLLDAAYGDWAQVVTEWALANGARVESWFTPHATQVPSNEEIVCWDPSRIRAHEVTIPHSEIPSCALGTR